jgi:hypothetical protein
MLGLTCGCSTILTTWQAVARDLLQWDEKNFHKRQQ